jgi:hypothetical protein
MAGRRPTRGVRKRISAGPEQLFQPGSSLLPSTANGSYYYYGNAGSKARHPTTPLQRVKSILSTLMVMSFPIGIFLLPYLLSSGDLSTSHPTTRIVVSLTTDPQRLLLLKPVLESILIGQTVSPDAVYLILPQLDYYTKSDLHYESTWPEYMNELLESTPLEIIQPEFAYGPITSIIYALEQEEGYTSDNKISSTTTTIITVSDNVVCDNNLIEILSNGRKDHPESLLAFSGTMLRSNFRQVRFFGPSEFDKFPNLHVTMKTTTTTPGDDDENDVLNVDIVQSLMGLSLSPNTVNWNQLLTLVQDESLPRPVLEVDGILLSAIMEVLNVTRVLVEGGGGESGKIHVVSNSTDVVLLPLHEAVLMEPSSGTQVSWMEAIHYLQQKWDIWTDYHLLNPVRFTDEQNDALRCEGDLIPDCTSHTTICLPNSACPESEYYNGLDSPLVIISEKEEELSDPI